MRKRTILLSVVISIMLVGCGTSFEVNSLQLENYANDNSCDYADVSSDYEEYDHVDGVYVAETENVHVELWDLASDNDASEWFRNNAKTLESKAKSNAGSYMSTGGDYSFVVQEDYYRLLFCKDKGIYAYGEKEAVKDALSKIGVAD